MEESQTLQKELSGRAREYLSQIATLDRLIVTMRRTRATLRNGLTGRSCAFTPDRVQSSARSRIDAAIATIMDLENEIDEKICTLAALKQQAFRLIGELPALDQRNILIARYVSGLAWAKIAAELHFSERTVYNIHGAALIEFGKILTRAETLQFVAVAAVL